MTISAIIVITRSNWMAITSPTRRCSMWADSCIRPVLRRQRRRGASRASSCPRAGVSSAAMGCWPTALEFVQVSCTSAAITKRCTRQLLQGGPGTPLATHWRSTTSAALLCMPMRTQSHQAAADLVLRWSQRPISARRRPRRKSQLPTSGPSCTDYLATERCWRATGAATCLGAPLVSQPRTSPQASLLTVMASQLLSCLRRTPSDECLPNALPGTLARGLW